MEALCVEVEKAWRREEESATQKVWAIRVLVIVVVLALWELAADQRWADPLLISKPTAVAAYLLDAVKSVGLWQDVGSTFFAALIGVSLGSALGIAAAIVLCLMPLTYRALTFFVTFFNALPRPALAPLFLVWFGLGLWGKIAVSITAVAFVLFYTTVAGIQSVEPDLLMLANSLRMKTWQRLRHVVIPSAAPSIIAGLRLGTALGILGVVVSEMVASYSGLGQRLVQNTNQFNIAGTFGVLIILGGLAVVIDIGMARIEQQIRR
ncbi:MAG TPA: ABC transporter permease [Acidimicrobiales bacterium]|nr:ABC transporter permease [Acidimicrobiales bacterium]